MSDGTECKSIWTCVLNEGVLTATDVEQPRWSRPTRPLHHVRTPSPGYDMDL